MAISMTDSIGGMFRYTRIMKDVTSFFVFGKGICVYDICKFVMYVVFGIFGLWALNLEFRNTCFGLRCKPE